MKNIKVIAIFLVIALGVLSLFIANQKNTPQDKRAIVAVTTFALYDVVSHIGGDTIKVVHILPFGVDPHSFEPTPKLMAQIEKSKLVIYSGAGLEPWTDGFTFKSKAINMSKYVHLRYLKKSKGATDPHYWLDFANMQMVANVVTKELIELFPQNKKLYLHNKEEYIAMLQKLDKIYREKLSNCRVNTVVVSHNALGYLAKNYGFQVESLTGLAPEAQPSAQDVTRIMQDIQKEGATTIFFENFVNDSVIKRIAKDTHIHLDVFQPMGNITKDEANAHLTYKDIMYKNLDKLSKALMCH